MKITMHLSLRTVYNNQPFKNFWHQLWINLKLQTRLRLISEDNAAINYDALYSQHSLQRFQVRPVSRTLNSNTHCLEGVFNWCHLKVCAKDWWVLKASKKNFLVITDQQKSIPLEDLQVTVYESFSIRSHPKQTTCPKTAGSVNTGFSSLPTSTF